MRGACCLPTTLNTVETSVRPPLLLSSPPSAPPPPPLALPLALITIGCCDSAAAPVSVAEAVYWHNKINEAPVVLSIILI
eukprot:SAG25_NODE_3172_length_1187_cov_1.123162_1_plen_80_part_00